MTSCAFPPWAAGSERPLFSFIGEGLPLLINHVSDVLNLGQAKFALGWVKRDLVLLQAPQDFSQARQKFRKGAATD